MNTSTAASANLFQHPFVIALRAIVLVYGGYLFGQWVYALSH
jgi:hypothetical protein